MARIEDSQTKLQESFSNAIETLSTFKNIIRIIDPGDINITHASSEIESSIKILLDDLLQWGKGK